MKAQLKGALGNHRVHRGPGPAVIGQESKEGLFQFFKTQGTASVEKEKRGKRGNSKKKTDDVFSVQKSEEATKDDKQQAASVILLDDVRTRLIL